MKVLRTGLPLAALLVLWTVPATAQFENVGSIEFPTSATGEAQSHFLRGVAILHSFGWRQAREEFHAAQAIDPDFAMAYWAESLAYNHPLVSSMDPTEPRKALERLAATPEERLAKAPTPREQGFLSAVEVLWGAGDHVTRRLDYMMEMESLYRRYPNDPEVAAFYALSMLSAAAAVRSGDAPAPAPMVMPTPAEEQGAEQGHDMHDMATTAEAPRRRPLASGEELAQRLNIRAGAIAQHLSTENPDHPGAPHYMIHAFDDPLHAPLALDAAYRFSEIAPAVSHARHMPTHIFIQLGMWDLVSKNNQSAYDAAKELWEPGDNDSMNDAVHALDWGQYGDLQLGDYDKAATWIRRLEIMASEGGFWGRRERGEPGFPRAVNTLPLLRARLLVESERWQVQPATPETSPHELLATALSAYHLGDGEALAQAEAELGRRSGTANEIMHLEAAALMHAAMGHPDVAIQFMDRAQAADEALPPPRGAASPIKPVHELYGELLMDLGRPADAVGKFQASLLRMPNRARSLLGLGRAYVALGTPMMAGDAYETIAEMWAGREDLPGMQEARAFWRMHLTGRAHSMMDPMAAGRLGM